MVVTFSILLVNDYTTIIIDSFVALDPGFSFQPKLKQKMSYMCSKFRLLDIKPVGI